LKALEDHNSRLKAIVADLTPDCDILQEGICRNAGYPKAIKWNFSKLDKPTDKGFIQCSTASCGPNA
jgi:hypothetical protein